MASSMAFAVMLLSVTTVLSVPIQMDWGVNPDLVNFHPIQQGTEHIKLMVVMVGDSIDLECQVAFATHPVSEIRWKINGDPEIKPEKPIMRTKTGDVFLEDHLKIDKITEEMDGSTVSCEYAGGQNDSSDWNAYSGRVEAVLRVFRLTIEVSEIVCDTCEGDVKLVFKENRAGTRNVEKRIKDKIIEVTALKHDDVSVNNFEYTVTLPVDTIKDNDAILARLPTFIINETVTDTWPCNCESPSGLDWWIRVVFMLVLVIIVMIIAAACCVLYYIKNSSSDKQDKIFQQGDWKRLPTPDWARKRVSRSGSYFSLPAQTWGRTREYSIARWNSLPTQELG
eukprot:GFUD01105746.1.p1 GENE.GFUD01105746.1~~GFUD01105746.1.p1  ORF type:complete len:338 (-),score=66.52 GFUD01105746.1:128-1141(-)